MKEENKLWWSAERHKGQKTSDQGDQSVKEGRNAIERTMSTNEVCGLNYKQKDRKNNPMSWWELSSSSVR